MNYREAQELSKTFHYAWLLLLIALVAWELPKDSQLPSVALEVPEAAKYTSLWVTKDAQRVRDNKVFWILMEINVRMAISRKLRFSPMLYANLQGYVEFKADFHRVSIMAWKDHAHKWYDLPYLETDDAIDAVLDQWLVEWCSTIDLAAHGS